VLIKKSFAYEFCEVYRYYQIILIISFSARFIFFTTHSASSLAITRPGKAPPVQTAGAEPDAMPVPPQQFDAGAVFIGGVLGGHVFASAGEHDRDATGMKKFENVSSPERYEP